MNVALCREDAVYLAGERLSASYRISRVPIDQLQSIEISVLWHSEGKGDEDLHVHHFQRIEGSQIRSNGLADSQSISCRLPVSPLSYHGQLIRLRWCIRLRLFVEDSREIVTEQPFFVVSHRPKQDGASSGDLPAFDRESEASENSSHEKGAIFQSSTDGIGFVHQPRSTRSSRLSRIASKANLNRNR